MPAELINGKPKFTPAVIKGIFLTIFGFAAIYFVGNFLNLMMKSYSGIALFKLIIAVSVFLLMFFFQIMFLRSKWQLNLVVFLEILVLAFCLKNVLIYKPILAGLVLFWIVLLYGAFLASREIENTLKINFYRINHIVFSEAITAFSLLLAVIGGMFFYNFLSQKTFDIQKILDPILESTIKSFPSGFTEGLSKKILGWTIGQGEQFKSLPEDQKPMIIEETLKQVEKELGGKIDLNVILKTKETQVFLQGLSEKFLNIPSQIKILVAIGVGLLVFFSFKGFELVLTLPLTFIAFLIYELLLAVNFAKITLEQRSKEKISL